MHEGGSHHPPGVHPGKEDDPVRGVHRAQFSIFYKPSVVRDTFLLTMEVWLKREILSDKWDNNYNSMDLLVDWYYQHVTCISILVFLITFMGKE